MTKTKKELVDYWLESAKKDIKIVNHLFEKKDYSYSLFFVHLALEKILKALFVKEIDVNAPYKHNLVRLAEQLKLKLSDEEWDFLDKASRFNIEARYPDVKFTFYKQCTREFTKKYVSKTKEFFKWMLPLIKS